MERYNQGINIIYRNYCYNNVIRIYSNNIPNQFLFYK